MKKLQEIIEESEESNVYDGCIIGEIYTSKQVYFIAKEYAKQALEEAAERATAGIDELRGDDIEYIASVDKQSILLLINELK